MTDKEQVIIDGVDVSECVSFDKLNGQNICCYEDTREDKIPFANFCVENKDCYFKQLQRKEQECQELKKQCDEHRRNAESYCNSYQYSCAVNGKVTDRALKYKQALDEVLSIATNSDMLPCADFEVDCTKCKDRITEKGKRCMRYGLIKIKNVVEKAKDNNNG